ncbi:EcoKI restriction-modification system protein HsdS [Mycoplasmopsis citelli]|uniref:EcoKI restriction-modification system protein HsdS n=1 Tax=Mycoplasmopsis citelli TaxID=171281 RepID=A0A449B334_9BACT|nr:restriction endonuclease subunit S [Mycoplasmopsis citelli]VEU74993.1 EcoKI restriction-modification system protein HsdS [Mycoplasmopsis citelli]
MIKKASIPTIRFKGFTETWEQRKLKEVALIHARIGWQNLRKSEFLESGDYYLITGTDFDNGRVNFKSCRYVEKWRYLQDKKIQIKNENVLITKAGTIGKVAFIEGLDKPATLNSGVYNIENVSKFFDSKFLFYFLNSSIFTEYINKKITGSIIKNLNQNIIENFPINYPNGDEQEKLGNLFYSLDNLISFHQRKYLKLEQIKKSLLKKMLPNDYKNTPYIRFRGFSESWKQRKLKEVALIHARIGWQNLRKSEFLESGDYYLITGTDFDNGRVNFKSCRYVEKWRYLQDKKIQIKNENVLITKAGTIGKVAFIEGLDKPATLNSGVYNIENVSKFFDSKFLFYFLNSSIFTEYTNKKITGSIIKNLNQNIIENFPINYPNGDEQEKLGKFFFQLDNLITLHQHKCEKLKKIKKSLLEKMLV